MFTVVIAAALIAAQPSAPEGSPGEQIALSESRGQRLYRYNRIAPYASGKAQSVLKDRITETAGYVVTESAEGQVLTFVGRTDDKPYAIWRGRYRDGNEVEAVLIPRGSKEGDLSDAERATYDIQRVGLGYFFGGEHGVSPISCAGDILPNIVVLSPTASDPNYLVYILTPQVDKDVLSMGGHYRMTLDSEKRVKNLKALAEGCDDVDLVHDGERLEAAWLTDKLNDIPSEIHVYSSLAADARIMVGRPKERLWKVENGKIEAYRESPLSKEAK